MLGSSRVDAQLAASREGLGSMSDTVTPRYNGLIGEIGCQLSRMSAMTERRGIHRTTL
jgi:hypothetical protein